MLATHLHSVWSSFFPLLVSPPKYSPDEEWLVAQTDGKSRIPRRLVWIDEKRFRGFGCSECAWVFNSSGSPTGRSFDEMMRNFELQRDREFSSHLCADHPRNSSAEKD
jgi:hypothetical protein